MVLGEHKDWHVRQPNDLILPRNSKPKDHPLHPASYYGPLALVSHIFKMTLCFRPGPKNQVISRTDELDGIQRR